MKSFWSKTALAAAALMCTAAAQAAVIDFESGVDLSLAPFAPLLADGDVVFQGNYFINTQDSKAGGGLIGQLSNGSDPTSCLNGTCPTGDTTNFLSVYNDGLAHVGNANGGNVAFSSVSAAYIATPGNASGSTVFFVVEGDRADGSYFAKYTALNTTGAFSTVGLTGGTTLGGSTGALSDKNFTDLFFWAYYCDGSSGSCNAFTTDKAQFAIDNIALDVAAVPEASTWALMLAGLGAVGAVVRRRRSV